LGTYKLTTTKMVVEMKNLPKKVYMMLTLMTML
jgi:hypothetical protein